MYAQPEYGELRATEQECAHMSVGKAGWAGEAS
jgi:hypothetical protein